MNCSLCSQRIASDKGNEFFGDTLCANCARRLKVGQHNLPSIEDTFLPAMAAEDAREAMKGLSMRVAHVAMRSQRASSVSFLTALYDRYREGKQDPVSSTGLILCARAVALYGSDAGKGLTDSETRYLMSVTAEQSRLLEGGWDPSPDGRARRYQILRALIGSVVRAFPETGELCARILAFERQ